MCTSIDIYSFSPILIYDQSKLSCLVNEKGLSMWNGKLISAYNDVKLLNDRYK